MEGVFDVGDFGDQVGDFDQFRRRVPSGDDEVERRAARLERGRNLRRVKKTVVQCDVEW